MRGGGWRRYETKPKSGTDHVFFPAPCGNPGAGMNLLIEDKGTVRIITLNRPEKRNALDTALTRDLLEALRTADAEEGMHCVVLTGAGPGFCAGADLAEFKGLKDPKAAKARAELTMQLHLIF